MSLILIVDDSLIHLELFSTVLKANGYEVLTAEDGKEGIDIALKNHPDLILMDINMPGMDGLSAVRELRSNNDTAKVPILAITASNDAEELNEAYQAGYTGHINKIIDPVTLHKEVQKWLNH
jgi:CheY-like chemotaxis protein